MTLLRLLLMLSAVTFILLARVITLMVGIALSFLTLPFRHLAMSAV